MKLNDRNYIDRDLSWMTFNHRILEEAQRENIPLLERINFMGIYSNNLDEFFRVRIATLNRISEFADRAHRDLKKRSEADLKVLTKENIDYANIYDTTISMLRKELEKERIHMVTERDLDEDQVEFVRDYCKTNIIGAISPYWLSCIKDMTALADDNIYMGVRLRKWNDDKKKPIKYYAIIELPTKRFGRFLMLPSKVIAEPVGNSKTKTKKYTHNYIMYMDDVIRFALPYMFPGTEFDEVEAWSFKFTKDAEMEMDSDIRGSVLSKIAKGVKSRRKGNPVRLIYDVNIPKDLLKEVMDRLGISKYDALVEGARYQNHKDLMKFPDCGRTDLKYPKRKQIMPAWAEGSTEGKGLISVIREKDRFVHLPYHCFDPYINLLREAAISPEVKGIKTTLYRLAKDSKVINSLIAAAKNGKKVTVVIELLARFDEEENIYWSQTMADAGIKVITGVEGLKVHSKVTLIDARDGDIAVISTGNFHEGNAKAYTDFMQMTARKAIVNDVKRVFEFIEHPFRDIHFRDLLVAPNEMKRPLLKLINQEIRNHFQGRPSGILCKLNHCTHEDVIKKIYDAAAAGVKVQLIVRTNCSLVPEYPELKGNLVVNHIVDRYLEHSRILIFANGCDLEHTELPENQDYKVFIGSADWMPRNLDNRIEVYAPVYDPDLKREAKLIVDYGMKDHEPDFNSQDELYKYYLEGEKSEQTS